MSDDVDAPVPQWASRGQCVGRAWALRLPFKLSNPPAVRATVKLTDRFHGFEFTGFLDEGLLDRVLDIPANASSTRNTSYTFARGDRAAAQEAHVFPALRTGVILTVVRYWAFAHKTCFYDITLLRCRCGGFRFPPGGSTELQAFEVIA